MAHVISFLLHRRTLGTTLLFFARLCRWLERFRTRWWSLRRCAAATRTSYALSCIRYRYHAYC